MTRFPQRRMCTKSSTFTFLIHFPTISLNLILHFPLLPHHALEVRLLQQTLTIIICTNTLDHHLRMCTPT